MFIINQKAAHLFKKGMSYDECAKTFSDAGFGQIPFGEYCLMRGTADYATEAGMPYTTLLSKLNNFCTPIFVTPESQGFGDTVAKITHATGLDKLAEVYTKITGRPCGCKTRQEGLNKLIPYGVREDV